MGDQIEKSEVGGECNTCLGEERCIQGFGGENLRERYHLEDPDIDGRIILGWIVRKWARMAWTGLIWLRIGTGGGHLGECGNKQSGSIKCREFLD